jgi:hydroxymethylglutaryl-CoA lyase
MMKIIESPREGMQGYIRIIPTEAKIRYINQLLRVGFDTVEIGSYVSPKLIPQMADSLELAAKLDYAENRSNIMFLAVNLRGAEVVAQLDGITHISYPFSFSPSFLKLNVNTTVEQSLETVENIVNLCDKHGKTPVIYISMAFGNPYGDPWSPDLLSEWVERLRQAGARIIPLSNVSIEIDAGLIQEVFTDLVPRFPDIELGLHLHTVNHGWQEKVRSAWDAGCRRFDGVMGGWGGCPMAGRELLGNLDTANLVSFAIENSLRGSLDMVEFTTARNMANNLFTAH